MKRKEYKLDIITIVISLLIISCIVIQFMLMLFEKNFSIIMCITILLGALLFFSYTIRYIMLRNKNYVFKSLVSIIIGISLLSISIITIYRSIIG